VSCILGVFQSLNIVDLDEVKVKLPPNARIVRVIHEEILKTSYGKSTEGAILFKCGKRTYLAIVEATGKPQPEDFKKLEDTFSKVSGALAGGYLVIKIIHHKGGVDSVIKRWALSNRVELVHCTDTVDLTRIMKERKLEC